MTNESDATLPSLPFEKLRIEEGVTAVGSSLSASWSLLPTPQIPAGASHKLTLSYFPSIEGLAWLKVKFTAPVTETVEYYVENYKDPRPEYQQSLVVVSHQSVSLLALLTQVNKNLKIMRSELTRTPPSETDEDS